jgi:hypothetical protein
MKNPFRHRAAMRPNQWYRSTNVHRVNRQFNNAAAMRPASLSGQPIGYCDRRKPVLQDLVEIASAQSTLVRGLREEEPDIK